MSNIPTPDYPGIAIVRNEYGWPIITAPNVGLVYEGLGFMQAFDRPWQLFIGILTDNGQLASVNGISALGSDIATLRTLYTEDDLLQQYMQWSPIVKEAMEGFVRGINAYYQQVLDGQIDLPEQFKIRDVQPRIFSLYEILNRYYARFQAVHSLIQNELFTIVGQLETKDPQYGEQLFNDVTGIPSITRNRWTVFEGDACGSIGDQRVEASIISKSRNMLQQFVDGVQEFMVEQNAIADFREKELGISPKGSVAIVLGPQKVVGNGTLGVGGPQNVFTAPPSYYLAELITPEYKQDSVSFTGVPFGPRYCTNGCYSYGIYRDSGTRIVRDIVYQPASDAQTYYTATVQIRGRDPVTTIIQRTQYGPVLGSITRGGVPTLIVLRTLFLDSIFVGADNIARLGFIRSFEELREFPNWPGHTDLANFVYVIQDGQGNIGAMAPGIRAVYPDTVDRRFPQGTPFYESLGFINPIIPDNQIQVQPPPSSFNERPYYIDWNSTLEPIQADYILPFREYQQSLFSFFVLDRYDSLTYEDLRGLFIRTLASSVFSTGGTTLLPTTSLRSQPDAYVLLRDRFEQAVIANPTPSRIQWLQFLSNYDGGWTKGGISASLETILSTPDVDDRWLLANTWMAIVYEKLFAPLYGGIGTAGTGLLVLPRTIPWRQSTLLLSLMVRLLVNPCGNQLFYPLYPDMQTINQIIAESLDQAVSELNALLGTRLPTTSPSIAIWGDDLRAVFTFTNEFVGAVGTIPFLARTTVDSRADIRIQGIVQRGHSVGPGVTEFLIPTPSGPVAAPSMTNLLDSYRNFIFNEFGAILKPLSCLVGPAPSPIISFDKKCCTPARHKTTNNCFVCPQ